MVRRWAEGTGLKVAEFDGHAVGASVLVTSRPDYVPPTQRRETYLLFLVSSREHKGKGIGSVLVQQAAADARRAGSEVLRVDCWAGAHDLIAWYERQGFARSDTFAVGDWEGQVFEMTL